MTLEPDGQATGCNPVEVGSTPTGVSSKETTSKVLVKPGQRRTVPQLTGWHGVFREWVMTKAMQDRKVSSVDRAPGC